MSATTPVFLIRDKSHIRMGNHKASVLLGLSVVLGTESSSKELLHKTFEHPYLKKIDILKYVI